MKFYNTFKLSFCCIFLLLAAGCSEEKYDDTIIFAISSDYPPFEYQVNGELVGFDVELGKMVAQKLNKKAEFQDTQYSAILAAVKSDRADAAISTVTITEMRKKNFDFSTPYYTESLAMIFDKNCTNCIKENQFDIEGKKIACQLGTTMEMWLKQQKQNIEIIVTDSNPQAVEMVKVGHVDSVLVDAVQAAAFSKKNPNLTYIIIGKANDSYAIAFKKGSSLKKEVDKALLALEKEGAIEELKNKYLK